MELRQLRYFTALARELNFSRAAEILHISQPTLSQQIAELEKELGGALFNRTRRSVSLTKAGKLLLENAEDMLYQIDQMCLRVQQFNNHERNVPTLRIAVDTNDHDLDRIDVIRAITDIHRQIPEAEFRIITVPFNSIRSALCSHDVDVAFYTVSDETVKNLLLPYKILKMEKMVLGVSDFFLETHPDADISTILKELPLCLIKGDHRWNNFFVDMLQRYEKNLQTMVFDSEGSLFDYAAAGLGFTITTDTLSHMSNKSHIVNVPIEDEDIRAIELVLWNEDSPNALRDALLEWIEESSQ